MRNYLSPRVIVLLLIFLGMVQIGCTKSTLSGPFTVGPSTDSVKISSITPDASKPLYAGDTVVFDLKINYVLHESSGSVSFVVQTGMNSDAKGILGTESRIVSKGSGNIKLKKSVLIPKGTQAVYVFTPLKIQGKSQSYTEDMRFFKVQERAK